MRQRTFAPVGRWRTGRRPTRNDPFDLFMVGDARLGREPLWRARQDGAAGATRRSSCVPESSTCARLASATATQSWPASSRAMPDPGRRPPLRQRRSTAGATGERHIRQFRRRLSLSRVHRLTGSGALEPAEAVYMTCNADASGRPCPVRAATLTFRGQRLAAGARLCRSAVAARDAGGSRLLRRQSDRALCDPGDRTWVCRPRRMVP